MLATAGGLLTRQHNNPVVSGIVDQLGGTVVSAVSPVKDENAAADVACILMPFPIRIHKK